MQWIPGGTSQMGADGAYPEEVPVHAVTVSGFWMDTHTVTNSEFTGFVRATGVDRRGSGALTQTW
jgi:formylglycine-generating enzyme